MSAEGICKHCGGEIRIRNPTGKCDHLYWPDELTDEAKIANGIPVEDPFDELERKAAKFDALLLAAKRARSDLKLPFSHSHDVDVRHAYMALSAGIEKAEKP